MSAIREASTLKEVVETINGEKPAMYYGGADTRSPEKMAGEYAFDAASGRDDLSDGSLTSDLELLSDEGAKFDSSAALAEAKAYALAWFDSDDASKLGVTV